MHLYLPSSASDERLELVDVDLSHASLVDVLGQSRLNKARNVPIITYQYDKELIVDQLSLP